MPKYVMHRKDFRILISNEEIDRNADYVPVSEENAKAISSGKKSGLSVLKEMLYSERERELRAAGADIGIDIPERIASVATGEQTDLKKMKVGALMALAASRGIVVPESVTKNQLVEMLSPKEDAQADAGEGLDGSESKVEA